MRSMGVSELSQIQVESRFIEGTTEWPGFAIRDLCLCHEYVSPMSREE